MNNKPIDDRAPMARALETATHITTIAITMVVPALPGYWLDSWLNTLPVFTLIGMAFGMAAGLWQLIRFVKRLNRDDDQAIEDKKNEEKTQINESKSD